MLKWLIRKKLDAFAREYDYDVSYLRDMLGASTRATLRFARAQGMGQHREGLSDPVWHAVKLAAIIHWDCGPCTQLCVTMAERAGIDSGLIRAVVAGDDAALPPDVRLAVQFARATLARTDAADALREEVVARFGRAGLVSIALTVTTAALYPTVKFALGYGHACQLVRVGGETVPRAAHLAPA